MGAIWTAQAFGPLLQQVTGFRHAGVTASSAALRPPDGDFRLYATTKHAAIAVAETLCIFRERADGTAAGFVDI